jgi:hypothetical protein
MRQVAAKKVFTAAAGITGLFLVSSAMAAPPQARQAKPHPQNSSQSAGQHLDLRAPAPAEAAEKSAAFPSMGNQRRLGSAEQLARPVLGSDNMRNRPGVQDFVRRVHQEGLPVARLFESRSALLHVGLSPRGKPGLWLVQKVH